MRKKNCKQQLKSRITVYFLVVIKMNGSDYPALYQNRHCYQSDAADVFILNTKTQYFGKFYDFSCVR